MKKDILRLFSSNLVKMLVTFITAFIVPMVLSVENYGYLKLYQFYASYVGISHLGFCDGIYLKYGGKKCDAIESRKIAEEGSTLFFYEIWITSLIFFAGIIMEDLIIACLGLTVVPSVMVTFYSYIYQASGEFKKYVRILNTSTMINLFINLVLVAIPVSDYRIYVVSYCAVQYVTFFLWVASFWKNGWILRTGFSFAILKKYIGDGILLLIGNFVYSIFLGIDKWFIKFSMDITTFSLYSFSSQMLTVVNMFITPISMTLYSHMSSRKSQCFEKKVKKLLLVIIMFVPNCIYAVKIIIKYFLAQYSGATNLVSVLLIAQIFLCLNTSVYVNLCKVYKKQKDYFVRMSISLMGAAVLDFGIYVIKPDMMGYAFATLGSCILWLALNMPLFPHLLPDKKELLYVGGLLGAYFLSMQTERLVLCIVIYSFLYVVLTYILVREAWEFGKIQVLQLLHR